MEDIVKIIDREIVQKMDNELKLINVQGVVLKVCGVKWAREGKLITDDASVTYKIVDVNYETSEITLDSTFTGQKAFLYRPIFVHGTPRETNEEWTKNPIFEWEKLPVIWLVEPFDETPFGRESSIERESEIRCVFFDSRDGTQWLTKNIHEYRTQSLLNMIEEFNLTVQKNRIFKRTEQSRLRNLNKLGTESLGSFEKNIINADLTAIDYRKTLSIYREYKCVC